jgi:glyoxylase-like metal-dependent hydrolase (beta-lactamase superfamily II)
MRITTITVGPFAMNCYLVGDEVTRQAIIIDPGAESKRLIEKITSDHWQLLYIVNTHCHIDHTAEAGVIQKHFKIPFYIHKQELPLLDSLIEQGELFGITVKEIPVVSSFLQDGDKLQVGQLNGTVLYTPGHSPGGISLLFGNHVFVGDCLFQDSIGRTDLYGGNYEQLIESITNKLLSLNDNTKVYSGHGPATTIGRERKYNPFLNGIRYES